MSESKITSIIAHTDHGKTTLLDSIVACAGHFSKSLIGEMRYLDTRKDEQEREITMKLTPIKLSNGHVFIDTPGHVDFENLLFSSSIMSDNQIILIDVNEGITPRTYSLVRFINKNRCVLVLNKIDKCESVDQVELVMMQINGLLGDEIFNWTKNNVILSSAKFGAGISYGTFNYSTKNSLKQAFKAFRTLSERIESGDVVQLMKKYNIRFLNKNLIFNSVMPLSDAIFNTVEQIYIKSVVSVSDSLERKSDFYEISFEEKPNFQGITMYAVLKERNTFKKENILLLLKGFDGKISRGDILYSTNETDQQSVVVEKIYDFDIERFIGINSFTAPGLVYIQGDFLKNSVVSSVRATCMFKNFPTPLFSSKLILKNLEKIDDMKSIIRVMGFTEQNLKVRLNRFSEFEFKCCGKVQFEKICYDLIECGFDFALKDPKKEFREFSTQIAKYNSSENVPGLEIWIGPASMIEEIPNFNKDHPGYREIEAFGNTYYIECSRDWSLIESVLSIFTGSGLLIKEQIIDTFFYIRTECDMDITYFNILKKAMSDLYLQTVPSICPLCYDLLFSVSRMYVSAVYTSLQKEFYVVESEEYNDTNEFTLIRCKVPQYILNGLIEDVGLRTRGTAYLEVCGSEYMKIGDLPDMILEIKKEKGMPIETKIINDPEKQRTLRR